MGAIIFGPPAAGVNLDGNSGFNPFDTPQDGSVPFRFQQVFDATTFASLAQGGGLLYSMHLRVDPFAGHPFVGTTIANIQVDFSTTSRSPDGLSSVYQDNVGADVMAVIGPTAVPLSGLGGGGFSSFDVVFNFRDHPFYYNPANGNLLLDFRVNAGLGSAPGGIAILDAFNSTGDQVSSVYGSAPTSGQVSSVGLATAFFITPIPEPSLLALMGLGLGILGAAGARAK